jgi:hypothetical protein
VLLDSAGTLELQAIVLHTPLAPSVINQVHPDPEKRRAAAACPAAFRHVRHSELR